MATVKITAIKTVIKTIRIVKQWCRKCRGRLLCTSHKGVPCVPLSMPSTPSQDGSLGKEACSGSVTSARESWKRGSIQYTGEPGCASKETQGGKSCHGASGPANLLQQTCCPKLRAGSSRFVQPLLQDKQYSTTWGHAWPSKEAPHPTGSFAQTLSGAA